jgi:hypothetical protein
VGLEDLWQEPRAVADRLLEFLGLEPTAEFAAQIPAAVPPSAADPVSTASARAPFAVAAPLAPGRGSSAWRATRLSHPANGMAISGSRASTSSASSPTSATPLAAIPAPRWRR